MRAPHATWTANAKACAFLNQGFREHMAPLQLGHPTVDIIDALKIK